MNDQNNHNEELIENIEQDPTSTEENIIEGELPENEDLNDEMSASEDETLEKDSRFKEGQEITLVNVRFPGNARSFPFLLGSKSFHYGQKVVAMSDRGMTVGYINSFPYVKPFDKSMLPLRTISKVATDEDLQKEKDLVAEEKRAERICVDLIEKHNLEMNLTHVEFTQFGKKAVFFFTAPNRVDFRSLVKDLVGQLKMRIELRQISVRDRAAALGAIGPCGLQTCCSSFHKNYGNVTIKMAKNQNLALMPNKINGVCGQIKCCIKYEHELYAEKRKKLPKENSLIQALNGDKGKILKLNILAEEFEMITTEGKIRRYVASQFREQKPVEDWRMPEQFENNIVNETKELIGAPKNHQEKIESENTSEDNQEEVQAVENSPAEASHPHDESIEVENSETADNAAHSQVQAQPKDSNTERPQQGQNQQRHPHHHNNRPRHHHGQGNNQRRPHNNNPSGGQQASGQQQQQGQQASGQGANKPRFQYSQRPNHNNRPRPQGQKPYDPNRGKGPQGGGQGNKDPKSQS